MSTPTATIIRALTSPRVAPGPAQAKSEIISLHLVYLEIPCAENIIYRCSNKFKKL